MSNKMIKITSKKDEIFFTTFPSATSNEFVSLMTHAPNFKSAEIFEVAKMKLSDLPDEVQEKVKSVLKVYNNANVVYEYGKFDVSAHTCIKSFYHYDHFVCGRYAADEVYTKEERQQNLAELNSHNFPEWAW